MGLIRLLGVQAPLPVALALFGGAWLLGQVLAHAGFPLMRLEYAEDGGELGRIGTADGGNRSRLPRGGGRDGLGDAAADVYLSTGVHQGPLVLDHSQIVVGEPGAVVRGGIVITSSDVTVRDLDVEGGEYGIEWTVGWAASQASFSRMSTSGTPSSTESTHVALR